MQTQQWRARAVRLAADSGGTVTRRRLRAAGVPRWLVQAELRTGRWTALGRHVVVVHNGPRDLASRRASAPAEVGPRAALDGASALQHLGAGLTDALVHVVADKGSSPRPVPGVRVHESRRFDEQDVVVVQGTRTVRAPVAAVHAALWARTDREAQLLLVVAVQQRLTTPDELASAVAAVRRHPRLRLLRRVVEELGRGVRALGELEVAEALRSRGLPEPDRQSLRTRASGRQYLDAHFSAQLLTLEVDGIQHDEPEHRLSDVLRDWEQVADGHTVLRLPLIAWRLDREAVLDRLEVVFRSRGWRSAA